MPRWNEDAKEYWVSFAERLRLTRRLLDISEQEAANALHVTLRTYRKWERGECHRDNPFGIVRFTKTFSVSIGWLIGGPEHGSPPGF